MPKILHTADLHLGTVFGYLDAERAKIRRKELLNEFCNTVNIAQKENVDYLLIAGDLFDNSGCTELLNYVNAKFGELTHTKVLIAAGNHDPKSGIYQNFKWAKNVYVFNSRLEKVSFSDCVIYGASFENDYQTKPLLQKVKTDANKINILLMHGDFSDARYNIIDKSLLTEFDYSALGHIHKYTGVERAGMSCFAYSGVLAPRGFDEIGNGGFLVGEVGKGFADMKRYVNNSRKYHTLKYNVNEFGDNSDLLAQIKNDVNDRDLYNILLCGSDEYGVSAEYIQSELENICFYADVKSDICEADDYFKLANDYSLMGVFVKNMLAKIENAENEQKKKENERVLKCGINALKGRGNILD